MANIIIPPARPHRDKARLRAVLQHYGIDTNTASVIFVRGHYLDTLGQRGMNDFNIFDDAAYLIWPGMNVIDSFNANTDPAFIRKKGRALAQLLPGHYVYYPDLHHPGKPKAYWALRPYPEGKILRCYRAGVISTCSATNIHRGGTSAAQFDRTFSEGCLTIYGLQYLEWKLRVTAAIKNNPTGVNTRTGQAKPLIDVCIVENKVHSGKQFWTNENGKIII